MVRRPGALTEAKIEREFVRRCPVWTTKLASPGNTGWPDRLVLIEGGYPLLIELKRPGGRLSAKQVAIITDLRDLGYRVEVCDSVADALDAVRAAMAAAEEG